MDEAQIQRRGASQAVTFVVAASDSLHPGRADYVCDGVDDNIEIQAAIDELPDRGGKIVLDGEFSIGAHITPRERLWLSGTGIGQTKLKLADAVEDDVIQDLSDFDTHKLFLTISDMDIDLNASGGAVGNGINLQPTNKRYWDSTFSDLFIYYGTGSGIISNTGHDYVIRRVIPEYLDGNGIQITDGSSMTIYDCTVKVIGTAGIDLRNAKYARVFGNIVDDMGTMGIIVKTGSQVFGNYVAHCISNSIWVHGDDNSVWGNVIKFPGNYGIDVASWSHRNLVWGNSVTGANVIGVQNSSSDSHIYQNPYTVTENSGTATLLSAGTSIVVTHGLAVTPVAGDITVVPMETWGNMTKFWIDTYTATQFTIHADIAPGADTDFAWKAIVL